MLVGTDREPRPSDYGHYQTETGVLCKACDEHLGQFEAERARFLNENDSIFKKGENIQSRDVGGYDVSKIKLAFMADVFTESFGIDVK